MKKYIVSVFTDFGRDGHGECGYHEVEVSATNEQTAISEAESIVMGEVEPGSVILECRVLGHYDEHETDCYEEGVHAMTNDQLRIEATKALMLYMSVNVPAEDITLLEANTDGSYIYFAIRGAKPAYALNRSGGRSSFRIYPSFNSYYGLILEV